MVKTTLTLGIVLLAALGSVSSLRAQQTQAKEPAKSQTEERYVYVKFETSLGDIVIELDSEKAPISVENFLEYVDDDYYEGTIFHRVIGTFMIQGGGFTEDMQQKKTNKPIKNEWKNGLKNKRGTIAMARTSAPDSATSQFFINVVDNASLDMARGGAAYAVFGKVVEGMDTVDKIRRVPTTTKRGMGDVPHEAIIVEKTERLEDYEPPKSTD